MSFRALDLFSGAGGLSLGLRNAGFQMAAAIDNWQPAADSYAANFDHPHLVEDIKNVDVGTLAACGIDAPLDVVAGGPPCQGFSVQRIGEDSDVRNFFVFDFARIVVEFRPRMFLMENVPGLLGKRGAAVARMFADLLHSAGYLVAREVLEAADYGLPQRRRRVFFVGWPATENISFSFPEPDHSKSDYRTVREAFSGLPSPPDNFLPSPTDPLHRRMRLSAKNMERLAMIPPGCGFESLPLEMRVACHRDGPDRIGHRNVYGRLDPYRPSGTITARFDSFTRGRFAHPWENRNISLREGARLQGFPDGHVFRGTQEEIAAQIGNAVPPPLAEAVCRRMFAALTGSETFAGQLPLALDCQQATSAPA